MSFLSRSGNAFCISIVVGMSFGCSTTDKTTIHSPKIVSSEFSRSHADAVRRAGRSAAAVLDEYSVPHLFAEQKKDLFFAQGYTHAYFRLWQMETSSRIVQGTLAEVIGSRGIEFDKHVFALNLDELVDAALLAAEADPATREIVENYLAGIHARLDQLDADQSQVPMEFRSRQIKPRRFSKVDIVRMGFARSVGQIDPFVELRLSLARARLGKEMFDEIFPWPQLDQIPVPVFKDAKAEMMKPVKGALGIGRDEFPVDSLRGTWIRGRNSTGSNAWTHAPNSTADGHSYLANDIHVHFRLPSLYFPMQMSTQGRDFLGGSIAGQPGFVSGTNGKVAIGFVASMADVGDWYRLKTHPKNPSKYRWNGKWNSFEVETRKIRVRGQKSVLVRRKRSHAGVMLPALRNREGRGETIEAAYRWTAASYSRSVQAAARIFDIQEARDCGADEILRNLGWLVVTCIDDRGQNGYWLAGLSPRRNLNSDPRLIQLAEKDQDVWHDLVPISENASAFPAEAGWPLANQMAHSNKSDSYVGWNFSPPFRAMTIQRKIRERSSRKWDLASILELQSDISDERFVLIKDELVRVGTPFLDSDSICERTFIEEIGRWDGLYRMDSLGATLATAWLRHTSLFLAREWYGSSAAEAAEPIPQWQIVRAILGPGDSKIWRLSGGKADKENFLRFVLKEICRTRFAEIKTHPDKYHWGILNSPRFSSLTGDLPLPTFDLRIEGGIFSVFSQGGDHGTILRTVMKVADPPEYYFAAPDGPSGDPGSPMSSVWTKTWASRSVMRLPRYTRQEIESHHGK